MLCLALPAPRPRNGGIVFPRPHKNVDCMTYFPKLRLWYAKITNRGKKGKQQEKERGWGSSLLSQTLPTLKDTDTQQTQLLPHGNSYSFGPPAFSPPNSAEVPQAYSAALPAIQVLGP